MRPRGGVGPSLVHDVPASTCAHPPADVGRGVPMPSASDCRDAPHWSLHLLEQRQHQACQRSTKSDAKHARSDAARTRPETQGTRSSSMRLARM
eukprot:3938924-Rhodomonas_salina.1